MFLRNAGINLQPYTLQQSMDLRDKLHGVALRMQSWREYCYQSVSTVMKLHRHPSHRHQSFSQSNSTDISTETGAFVVEREISL
jgi:hypothetical protein